MFCMVVAMSFTAKELTLGGYPAVLIKTGLSVVALVFLLPLFGLRRFAVDERIKGNKCTYDLYLSSYNGMDESVRGKWRLFEVLQEAAKGNAFIWCSCERPLFNVSAIGHVEAVGGDADYLHKVSYDSFKTQFYYEKDEKLDEVLHMMVEHFLFFSTFVLFFCHRKRL